MVEKFLSSRWAKFLFAMSVMAFVGLQISSGNRIGLILNIPVAFILALYMECRYKVLAKLFEIKSKKYVFVSLPIAVYTVIEIVLNFYRWIFFASTENSLALEIRSHLSEQIFLRIGLYTVAVVAGIVTLFVVFATVYAIVSRFKKYALLLTEKSDRIERWYVIIGTVVFSALIIFIYSVTVIAYTTQVPFDLIFTMDSGFYVETDTFFNLRAPENDIRQPLFALLTMPFAIVAKILAIPFFFLPSAYILIMQIIQVAALLIMAVLMVQMAGINRGFSKVMFLILYTMTYPVLLFSFTVEQYIPSVFIAVLTIYICSYQKKLNIWLVALSTGIILTNAIIVPFVTYEKKLMGWLQSIAKTVAAFIVLCVFSGKLPILFGAFGRIRSLLRFADIGIGYNTDAGYNKLYQFTHFVENCFIAPQTDIVYRHGFPTFQLATPTGISLLGVVLLCIPLVSVIINRKIMFAKTCGLWILFSIAILYVIGWGSPENGMILYSLYFSWAFFGLVFLFFEKLLKKQKIIRYAVYSALFIVMSIININGIIELVQFGIEHYPAR